MKHEITCCDLCGSIIEMTGRKPRRRFYFKAVIRYEEIKREPSRDTFQSAVQLVSYDHYVCEECAVSVAPIADSFNAWIESRKGANTATITVQEASPNPR